MNLSIKHGTQEYIFDCLRTKVLKYYRRLQRTYWCSSKACTITKVGQIEVRAKPLLHFVTMDAVMSMTYMEKYLQN